MKPNIEKDAQAGVDWLEGSAGRKTLRLMGNTEANNKPSTLEEEKQRMRDFITATNQITWMIRRKGGTVGAVWIDLEDSEYLAAPAIHIMIGNPEARGKGVGEKVINAVIGWLKQEKNYPFLYSRHLVDNVRAAKLLKKLGFANFGSQYSDQDGLYWQNVRLKLV